VLTPVSGVAGNKDDAWHTHEYLGPWPEGKPELLWWRAH